MSCEVNSYPTGDSIRTLAESHSVKCKLQQLGVYCIPGKLFIKNQCLFFSSTFSKNLVKISLDEIISILITNKGAKQSSLFIQTLKKSYRFGHVQSLTTIKHVLQSHNLSLTEKIINTNNNDLCQSSSSSIGQIGNGGGGGALTTEIVVNNNDYSYLDCCLPPSTLMIDSNNSTTEITTEHSPIKASRRSLSVGLTPMFVDVTALPPLRTSSTIMCSTTTQTSGAGGGGSATTTTGTALPPISNNNITPSTNNTSLKKAKLFNEDDVGRIGTNISKNSLRLYNSFSPTLGFLLTQKKWLMVCLLIIFILLIGLSDLSMRVHILNNRLAEAQNRLNSLHNACKMADTCNSAAPSSTSIIDGLVYKMDSLPFSSSSPPSSSSIGSNDAFEKTI